MLFRSGGDYYASLRNHDKGRSVYFDLVEGEKHLYAMGAGNYPVAPAYRTDIQGKGSITYIPFDFCKAYYESFNVARRNFMREVLSTLIEKRVEANTPDVDLVMQKDEDSLYVSVINVLRGKSESSYDEIPPLHNVTVKIYGAYQEVALPFGDEYLVSYGDGYVEVTIKHLDVHTVIVCK